MQIRLTVLGPRSGRAGRGCDVLVTAPEGTPLGTVAGALATAAGSAPPGGRSSGSSIALYAGPTRLPATAVLGVPPLVDGALLSLHAPAGQHGDPGRYGPFAQAGQYGSPPAQSARLHVTGGPDAGGVHLLHGGQIRIGRSADADVPLDDPDVSRLHCEIDIGPDGRITVADLDSTNGTTLAGRPVGPNPVPFTPGALLQIGESTLRLDPAHSPVPPALPARPDGDGHLRVALREPTRPPAGAPPAAGTSGGSPAAAAQASRANADGEGGGDADRTDQGPDGDQDGPGRYGAGPADTAAPGDGPGGTGGDRSAERPGAGTDPGPHTSGAPGRAENGTGTPPAVFPRQGTRGGHPVDGGPHGTVAPHNAAPTRTSPPPASAYDTPDHAGRGAAAPPGTRNGSGHTEPPAPGTARQAGANSHPYPYGTEPGSGGGSGGGPSGAGGQDTGGEERRATGERPRPGALRPRGVGAISAWAKRHLGAGRRPEPVEEDGAEAEALRTRWPDPADVLLTVLGPGRRLWERGLGHPDALTVRLGTADLPSADGLRRLPAVPFTVDLRAPGTSALTLAGPRPRLSGLARAVLAQLCALHSPGVLEVVLLSADRARGADQRAEEWAWLNWLPHLRPAHGQDCRLLLAFDRDQADARTAEVVRRLEAGPLGPSWATAPTSSVTAAAAAYTGPYTVLVVDGDPGSAGLRETVARIAEAGPSAGVHVLCLAEAGERPVIAHGALARLSGDVATALRVEPALPLPGRPGAAAGFSSGAAAGSSSGAVYGSGSGAASGSGPGAAPGTREGAGGGYGEGGGTHGGVTLAGTAAGPAATGSSATGSAAGWDEIVVDAVSADWAEHFARALAPLREADGDGPGGRSRYALPSTVRLLDELDLAVATPAKVGARWAAASGPVPSAVAILGVGAGGRVALDLAAEGPHAAVGGAPGSGKTELLRSLTAALAASERPDRLALVLIDGAGQERGAGLAMCAELPHVAAHLVASDPVRMREFAQALGAELKRRAVLLDGRAFAAWHAERAVAGAIPHQGGAGDRGRDAGGRGAVGGRGAGRAVGERAAAGRAAVGRSAVGRVAGGPAAGGRGAGGGAAAPGGVHEAHGVGGAGDGDGRDAGPFRFRAGDDAGAGEWGHGAADVRAAGAGSPGPGSLGVDAGERDGSQDTLPAELPRLVVIVDDFDALVAPALGAPGRPAAGSVVRALEAVARDGERLGVHLVTATERPERTAGTDADERARLRIALRTADAESAALLVNVEDPAGLDDAVPGRGYLRRPGGAVSAFQTGRVSARIPRTATLRPTVVALEWERMGDPPARRQVRELGNGPTDLALLASALQRAAEAAGA